MKAYLAIKYHKDGRNHGLIREICEVLRALEIETIAPVIHLETDGKKLEPKELMQKSLAELRTCDILIAECSEKSVGLGIEAGYAFSIAKPIILIAKEGSEVSPTLLGIAEKIIFYNNPAELSRKIRW